MIAPCSVKAQGNLRRPPRVFDIAICDIKVITSCGVRLKTKSEGNLAAFLLTCSFSLLVLTP